MSQIAHHDGVAVYVYTNANAQSPGLFPVRSRTRHCDFIRILRTLAGALASVIRKLRTLLHLHTAVASCHPLVSKLVLCCSLTHYYTESRVSSLSWWFCSFNTDRPELSGILSACTVSEDFHVHVVLMRLQ